MQKAYGKRIHLFDKTKGDIVCPHFYIYGWARGCKFNCSWCYLNGTFRFQGGKKPHIYDVVECENSLRLFVKKAKEPQILNAGELSDGLLNQGFVATIAWNYLHDTPHKILILTKDVDFDFLETQAKHLKDTTIVSYSLNANRVALRWEKGTPDMTNRIIACKQLFDLGYEVRIRIDPIVPIEGAVEGYKELIDVMFERFEPNRITLGSLRGLQSTINNCTDKSWVRYLTEKSDWGLKVGETTRLNLYTQIIVHLDHEYDYRKVALCKETVQMWERLNLMDWKNPKCNCVW